MKLIGLGHSELFIEIKNTKGKTLRILSDSWLSDYAFGDFMERSPRLNIAMKELPLIDGIFLSHAHCDHFDPYTLTEIYKYQSPDILLPETLTYLEKTLKKHLPKAKIYILPDREISLWKNLELFGIVLRHTNLTNEDDVMTLSIANEEEIIYLEVDTAIPETEDIHEELWKLFHKKNYETVCHLATRNELEGIFKSLDAKSPQERQKLIKNYKEKRKEEIEWQYAKYDEGYEEYADLSQAKNSIKIFNGQGIVYPADLSIKYDEILIPLSLEEICKIEENTAKNYRRKVLFGALTGGEVLELKNGKIQKSQKPEYLKKITSRNFSYNSQSTAIRTLPNKPVSKRSFDLNLLKSQTLDFLNNRFLPYQIGNIEAPLRELVLRSPNKKYVIAIKTEEEILYFSYSFESIRFKLSKHEEHYNEIYWASDLADLYEGKQEMFSTFLHSLEKEKPLHFWNCLGMPFIASDIVQKKMEFHFQEAQKGRTVNDFAQERYKRFV